MYVCVGGGIRFKNLFSYNVNWNSHLVLSLFFVRLLVSLFNLVLSLYVCVYACLDACVYTCGHECGSQKTNSDVNF